MLRLLLPSMLALAIVLGATLVTLAQAPSITGANGRQRPLAELKGTRSDIKLSAQLDKPDSTYRVGEALTITVTATEEVYLTILNVGSSGRVSVLAPNAHHKLVRAAAQKPTSIPALDAPYAIRVGGPAGFELIKVIATKEPVDLLASEPSKPTGPFRTLEAATDSLARNLLSELDHKLQQGYAATDLVFRVVDNSPAAR